MNFNGLTIVDKQLVEAARREVREIFPETPLQLNEHLSRRYGASIWLKREDLSPVRSYKIRGAFNFLRKAVAKAGKGKIFVCASAGNHAQGFAFACRHFGVHGVVFMPVTTPQQKIEKTRIFGGEFISIRLVGDIFDQCYAAARQHVQDNDGYMVPPFDHEDIIEGQATVAAEIMDQLPDGTKPDIVVMPVGGGGLSAGLSGFLAGTVRKENFVFCEPEGAPSLKKSLERGEPVTLNKIDNFVDGAAVARIGDLNFKALKDFPADQVQLIPENAICVTIIEMLNLEGVVLEPAGALSIAALEKLGREKLEGKTVVAVVSGGNFDFERLPDVKERAMRYTGVKKYFILRLPQRPGALRDFLNLLGPDDDIARFEYLKKSARNFGSILIGIETSAKENFAGLLERFEAAGLGYEDITENDILSNLII
ncbi:threonine ammonia-lyase [Rhizobium pusense]|jgi:threonine dehydratase|uniref:L-threonine dehydratase n=5 Tax=Hyphomicrobiales TaxID=356 RepID=A0A1L9CHU9_9HYPH|nr:MULTISPECIES: threonine ammonia-lyase [Rhizobium/Agrobacterium group]AMD58923.1 threonine dehydratase [Agrobacterium tumefaciens]ANV25051.1 threonine dehydratase [Rhizobium sp. S41]AUC09480.1 threonine dehydratase [Rhizobium sp. Y9]EKJ96427.1 threonine dehydratase [Bradyrhizobium lupini HPC(L)]MBM7322929.1 threonine ammonia-lyase [Agrobacterium sp. S2]MDP9732935.1 threonine dehydratase [Rhizobium sp. SORGH_AS_0285]MDP9755235.1 threonine dehydratase [Rhizobium sp. SORGH_AS_0260]MDP9775987